MTVINCETWEQVWEVLGMKMVKNEDSRNMQALPWIVDPREDGKAVTLSSQHSGKVICSFWGGDERDEKNYSWCTEAQMQRHAKYAEHVLNMFPHILGQIEEIYRMEDMPEEAIKAIEGMMEHIYLEPEEMPPYAK